MKKTVMAAVAAMVLAPAMSMMAQESTWKIDSAHSGAEFTIRHLGVSNVRGTIHKITGEVVWDEKDVSKDRVTADLDVTTINTDEPKRDEHLKTPEFFDTAKYPTMHFVSTGVKRNGTKLQVMGNLTLAGVTKPVTLDVDGPVPPQKGMRGGLVSGFSASTTISRKEFNFGQKYGAPMLGDEVKINIDIEMGKQ